MKDNFKIPFYSKALCLFGFHKFARFYNESGYLNTKKLKCYICSHTKKL